MKFFDILAIASAQLSMHCVVNRTQHFAEISKSTGEQIRVLQARFPLNSAPAARSAGDKLITKALLTESGLAVPEGSAINLKGDWQVAFQSFSRLGEEAVVKPANGERGALVFCCWTYGQLAYALSQIAPKHASAMVEEYVEGQEFRVLVLDSEPLYILERQRLTILADGTSTLLELIAAQGLEVLSSLIVDPRLSRMAGTPALNKVLPQGVPFVPIYAANAVNGVTLNVDVSSCPDVARLAVSAVATLGLRYGGVDLIVEQHSGRVVVLEVNSAPELEGFDAQGQTSINVAVLACCKLLAACF